MILINILIPFILVFILLYTAYKSQKNKTIKNNNWHIRTNCKYLMPETLQTVLNEINKFYKILYMPCTYQNIDKEYEDFEVDKKGIYFLIDGINILIAKQHLYKVILMEYGITNTEKLFPKTWIIEEDKKKFIKEFDKDKIYIVKKNVQRQNGLKIYNDLDKILSHFDEQGEYPSVVVQELLQNPYLIDGRKINLRVYVLATKIKDNFNIYVYNDGFMYYTAEKFIPNSLDPKVNITTGYIDRNIYKVNPLTHQDFRQYLIKNHDEKTADLCFNNMYDLIKKIFGVFLKKIGNMDKLYNNLKFQLFGVDIAIDNEFNAKIMEVNKGPDLGGKDKRDYNLKHNMVRNMLNIVKLCKLDVEDNFIKL
jgi:hypothetical protein